MAHGTPDQVAARWAQRLGQSTDRIREGIQATSVAPGQAAARQKEVWAQNVANSKDKWASRVAQVSLQEWQDAAINKGVTRIAAGATAAQPKMQAFLADFLPFVDNARSQLPARGSLDQNIARMTQFVTKMATYRKR